MNNLLRYCSAFGFLFAVGCAGSTEIGSGGTSGSGNSAGSSGTAGTAGTGNGGSGAHGGSGGTGGGTSGTSGTGGTGGSVGGTGGSTGGAGGSGAVGGAGTSGGGSGGGTYDPCAGKTCGDVCTLCAPNDPMCGETADEKHCDATGQCHSGSAPTCSGSMCQTAANCAVPDVCKVCSDGSTACATADCVNGACVTSFPACPGECTADSDCPVSKVACQACADGSMACPWARCEAGQCSNGVDTCPTTDPCAGKTCGDKCTTCTGPDCAPSPTVVMYCDAALNCTLNSPSCGVNCNLDSDCPLTDVCVACPDNTCATTVCSSHTCVHHCATDPCGGCATNEICIYQVGGPGPSHYTCAYQAPCGAAGACACIMNQGTCTTSPIASNVTVTCQCDNGLQ